MGALALALVAFGALVAASALLAGGSSVGGALASHTSGTPNILVIMTDDQRDEGTMGVMPQTLARFDAGGTEFTEAYVTTPECCPSRASIFSGRYVHNNGVRDNFDSQNLDQRYTLQRYLDDAGYRTAIFGKYMNAWDLRNNPPRFDDWSIFSAGYNPVRVNDQGTVTTVTQYSTDYVADKSVNFIQQAESNDSQPWLMFVHPYAPHSPFTPSPTYAGASVPPHSPNPGFSETDLTDKPQYVQARPDDQATTLTNRENQLRTLMSVDDLVADVFGAMDTAGETSETLAIFTSDNGYAWGEHGLEGKGIPYLDSIAVPMFVTWPGHVTAGADDNRLAANIDLAPTALDAVAGASPIIEMDGDSLLEPTPTRTRLLTEFWDGDPIYPSWASILTPSSHYTEYYDEGGAALRTREYYDRTADPFQLDNLLGDANPGNDPATASLAAQLAEDRVCTGSACP